MTEASIEDGDLVVKGSHVIGGGFSPIEFNSALPRAVSDIETYRQRGGRLRVIASIEAPAVIERILEHLGQDGRPSTRRIRPERRPRTIAKVDRFLMFVTTRATVSGQAGFGLRPDAPAFLGGKGKIHAPG